MTMVRESDSARFATSLRQIVRLVRLVPDILAEGFAKHSIRIPGC